MFFSNAILYFLIRLIVVAVAYEASASKTELSTNEAFDIALNISDLDYSTVLTVDVTGEGFKFCAMKLLFLGANIQCTECVKRNISIGNDLKVTMDITATSSVLNSTGDNQMSFMIIGQTLDLEKENTSVLITITDAEVLWSTELFFNITANNSVTISEIPNFGILVNKNWSSIVYVDLYTEANASYDKMIIDLNVNSSLQRPALSMCNVQVHQIGSNIACLQMDTINKDLIRYQSSRIKTKNEMISIELPSFCNRAYDQSNVENNRIRIAIFLNSAKVPMNLTIRQALSYRGQTTIQNQTILVAPSTNLTELSSYSPSLSVKSRILNTESGRFGLFDVTFTTQPNTVLNYALNIDVINSYLSSGTVSLCSVEYSNIGGRNIPCRSLITNEYKFINFTKVGVDAVLGDMCNTGFYDGDDDNTVTIQVLTRPTVDSLGDYELNVTLLTTSASSNFTENRLNKLTLEIGGNTTRAGLFDATFVPIDATTLTVCLNCTRYPIGQTLIFRYNLTVSQFASSYNLTFSLSTSKRSHVEVPRLFLGFIGDNFPCMKSKKLPSVRDANGSTSITIDDLCHYPIDPTNETNARTISLYAHVRVPKSSNDTSLLIYIDCYLDGTKLDDMSRIIEGTIVETNIPMPTRNTAVSVSATRTYSITTLDTLTVGYSIFLPMYTNARIVLRTCAIDNSTNYQFGKITSARIASMGRDVDGVFESGKSSLISISNTSDCLTIDFGIVTNTGYSTLIDDNQTPRDGQISIIYSITAIPNIQANSTTLNTTALTSVSFYSTNLVTRSTWNRFSVNQTAFTMLIFRAVLVNSAQVYPSKSRISIDISINHHFNSALNATAMTIKFYLPPFVVYTNYTSASLRTASIHYSRQEGIVSLQVDQLNLGRSLIGRFQAIVDPNDEYEAAIGQFGSEPKRIEILYEFMYARLPGNMDTLNISKLANISYIPSNVTINPMQPLKEFIKECQITASVNEAQASRVFSPVGWKFDYRSSHWYETGSNYVMIAFGNLTRVSMITLQQLLLTVNTTRFDTFRISYSNDTLQFNFLPEETCRRYDTPFEYRIPFGNSIVCRYLRVHVMSVLNPSDLETRTSGLLIRQIYGAVLSSDRDMVSTCASLASKRRINNFYYPKTALFIPRDNMVVFICDIDTTRSTSFCYKYKNNSWQILTRQVSNIAFWTLDYETSRESLYGIGSDKETFIRSDDQGQTWKSVSPLEFNSLLNDAQSNSIKYLFYNYTIIDTEKSFDINEQLSWKANVIGMQESHDGNYVIDWFN